MKFQLIFFNFVTKIETQISKKAIDTKYELCRGLRDKHITLKIQSSRRKTNQEVLTLKEQPHNSLNERLGPMSHKKNYCITSRKTFHLKKLTTRRNYDLLNLLNRNT